jgi:Ni,Fe-hydrogenase III large subunit
VDIVGHPWLKPVRRHPELTAGPSDGGGGNRYPFFTVRGMQVHEVAVGPVHAGIIEPGHFRFQCYGEKVLHLEIQLGYQHRGIEALLSTADGPKAAILAESVAGDSTVAHALAHCELVEALAACAVPPRALAIRLLALELERVTNHLGDLGMLANDVGFLQPAALFGRLRGEFLNLTLELAGNRLGRGLCRAGGVKHDIDLAMAGDWRARLPRLRREAAAAADVFFSTPALLARLEGVGRLPRTAAERLGLVGPAARASGCSRDVRRDHPAGAYLGRTVSACTCTSGDVQARANVRWLEVLQSLQLIASWLDDLPESDVRAPCASLRPNALGVALTEGWRGETLHAAITDGEGRIRRYKVVDPSFHNWIGLALAMRDEAISDFPLCNKSFNLSYAGHDL